MMPGFRAAITALAVGVGRDRRHGGYVTGAAEILGKRQPNGFGDEDRGGAPARPLTPRSGSRSRSRRGRW